MSDDPKTIPKPQLADNQTKILWQGSSTSLMHRQRCLGGAIYHPSHFYLNTMESWNALEALQKELNEFFERERNQKQGKMKQPPAKHDPSYKPDPQILTQGMFVTVFHLKEWHRGMVLKIREKKPEYKIMMIDYGEHRYCSLSEFRLIHVKFLQKLPAQAIRCSLLFSDDHMTQFTSQNLYWTNSEADLFLKGMKNREYEVDFVRYEIDYRELNPIKWHVRIHRLRRDEQDEKTPAKKSLDQGFLEQLQELWREREHGAQAHDEPNAFPGPRPTCQSTADYSIDMTTTSNEAKSDSELNISLHAFKGLLLPDN